MSGGYDWFVTTSKKDDGCSVRSYDDSKLYEIIKKNRYNRNNKVYACEQCKTFSQLDGSYIALVDEEDFLEDPEKYIENVFDKSEKADDFELTKGR